MTFFSGNFKDGFGKHLLGNLSFRQERKLIETVRMTYNIIKGVDKYQGRVRAAIEYVNAFNAIEDEYKKAKELFEKDRDNYDSITEDLITKLSDLEEQKKELEKQVMQRAEDVSKKHNIPIDVVVFANSTKNIMSSLHDLSILNYLLNSIYRYTKKKFSENELEGYLETKKLLESEIAKYKQKLNDLISKGSKEIQELKKMIVVLLDAIAEEQMKIAELKILLRME